MPSMLAFDSFAASVVAIVCVPETRIRAKVKSAAVKSESFHVSYCSPSGKDASPLGVACGSQ